ncbi:hypothetical protein Slin15195_G128480 [Septoria linicola]|uniref:Uncharacterized protein n=1 Tax=Septoria linicola TaxID=215465 RepID=A0A9Q9B208_9PEZI|nr:hypothetical protein Slin14017_G084630 [Septoria linicola]USW59529.1 hypothetical protein Slin15195_G128480 [Septoria linicola]
MEDHGSRFLNLEMTFGNGFCLVLKTGIAKDFFEKQLQKKPCADRSYVIHHITFGTDIPQLAKDYADLRDSLVHFESRKVAGLHSLVQL